LLPEERILKGTIVSVAIVLFLDTNLEEKLEKISIINLV
jgi:hypothetical protein